MLRFPRAFAAHKHTMGVDKDSDKNLDQPLTDKSAMVCEGGCAFTVSTK